jgi:hypothetical protein
LKLGPSPYRVTGIKVKQITAKRRGVTVTRNSSHFKHVIPYLQEVDNPYSNSSEEELAAQQQQEDPENDIADELSDEDIDNAEQDQPLNRYPRRENRDIRPQYYEEIG